MFKKILPIFFILCLVFSLTVPCFAYTEVGGALVVDNLGATGDFTRVNPSNNYDAYVFSTFSVEQGKKYALYIYTDPFISGSQPYQVLLYGNGLNTLYTVTNNNIYKSSPLLFTAAATSNYLCSFISYVADTYTIHFSYFVFEVPSDATVSFVNTLMNSYHFNLTNDYSRGSHTFFLDGFTGEEIPEFLSSTLHTFDFLGLSTVPYIPLLIVFFGITAILTFIFVIIFMIKRLTGGS